MKIATAEKFEEMVHQGESVLFLFVVWERVLAMSIGVVAAAIFIAVVSY